jgi:hypothetical protein
MTPPLDFDAACSGCFLHERTGGVCPMARDGGFAAVEALRQAAVLRTLVLAEAPDVPSLIELVRLDAAALPSGAQRTPSPLALPAATAQPIHTDSRKEATRVALSRSPR